MATEKRLIDANAPRIEKHFSKRLVDAYALVDTIEEITWYHVNAAGRLVEGANSSCDIPLYKANDIFSALGSARTVDAVEVLHGHWIEKEYVDEPYGGYYLFHCSECGIPNARERNYCPNCGAKMDGDGNE